MTAPLDLALALVAAGVGPQALADPEVAAGLAALCRGPVEPWTPSMSDAISTVAMAMTGIAVLATLVSNRQTSKVLRRAGAELRAANSSSP